MTSEKLSEIGIENITETETEITFSTDALEQYEKAIKILKEDGWNTIDTEAMIMDTEPKIVFPHLQSFYAKKKVKND